MHWIEYKWQHETLKFHKNIKQHNCFKIDKKYFLSIKSAY